MSLSLTCSLVRVNVSPVSSSAYSGVQVKCVAMAKTPHDLPIQVRGKGQKEQSLETFSTVSRRAIATQLAIASLAATINVLPEPAEARVLNPEIKRKIFEKLKMLREKVGLSKHDTENEEKTSSPAVEKEKPLPQLPLSPLPVQTSTSFGRN
ncbi:hypothetical protein POM88_015181 [Heracleum sosnowskyi]|uniref:Uncharacterized protein n=1 Tax=Heracleum sosnowskyi TaxID=360622 RepID=A0AAD8MX71_9APIA|nr:hypothetical protein POM88_015181 [Heracleum sosnowskyi]